MVARLIAICAIAVALSAVGFAADPADRDEDEGEGPHAAGEQEGPELLIERGKWFASRHRGSDGNVRADGRNKALAELQTNLAKGWLRAGPEQRIAGDGWSALGPAPLVDGSATFSGRVTSIAVHPSNSNIAYVGGAQGGVWKTTDHGVTWAPLTDTQASLAIGSVAIANSNPAVVYAGTGEANGSCDSYFGAGILRTVDSGAHWTLQGATHFANTSVGKILVHPGNANILWAANTSGTGGFICFTQFGIFGVWRSTDGGVTWTLVLGVSQTGGSGHASDLAADPTNPNIIYAGMNNSGVWKTTNGGTTWMKLAGGLPASVALGRVAIAVDPVSPSTVYATFENANTGRQLGTYKTTNGGTVWSPVAMPSGPCQNWTFQDACTYSGSSFGQCWYDLVIGVAPDQSVWLGGAGIFRSTNAGTSWSAVCPQSVHVDQHALAFKGSDVWLGNDGGVFSTNNGGASWTSRNPGLSLTQFYPGGSLDPSDATHVMGGAQDNGVMRHSGTPSWAAQFTGDGASTAISFDDPANVWYGSTQFLAILRTTNGGLSWNNATAGLSDANTNNAGFVSPFVMCPNDAEVLIAGSDNVWRTEDGASTWTSNSPDPLDSFSRVLTLAFAKSPGNCDTYFAGDDSGRVFRTTDAGSSWADATGNLPLAPVVDLAVDPTDPAIVIAGLGGFSTRHTWRTTNALDLTPTWNAIDLGVPATPVNAVLIDPDNPSVYYIGTDIGIFRTLNSGGSWEVFMGGHPNVAVYDLQAESGTGTIVSFTHGRGAFKLGTFCSDSDACTDDRYDQIAGCQHTPKDCSDTDLCTVDSCSAKSGCANVPIVCTAPDNCHDAGCDAGTGLCATVEKPDGEPCDDLDACTQTDTCQTGACVGADPVPPPDESAGQLVDRSGTDALITWDPLANATTYDVLRGSLAAFPVGPGAEDETCFTGIDGTLATDPEVPADGAGFWYLVRGANACAGPGPYGFQFENGVSTVPRVSTTCP